MPEQKTDSQHQGLLDRIVETIRTRHSWSAYAGRSPSGPSREEAEAHLEDLRGTTLDLAGHPGDPVAQSDEISPYTGLPLGSIDDARLTHKGKRGALARLRHRTRFNWEVFTELSP